MPASEGLGPFTESAPVAEMGDAGKAVNAAARFDEFC